MRPYVAALAIALSGCSTEVDSEFPPEVQLVRLPPRTEVSGTRFRRLDPQITGVAFTNELRAQNVLPYIYSGAGVAVSDYDADGLPDIFLVSQDGPNRLYRQVAPLRFEDVTASAGGLDGGDAWGTAATFVDIEGDGDLDLYVCNLEAPNLLYRNDGDGTFTEIGGKFGLAISAASTGATFADYDNDGDLDLYLLTNRVFGPRLPEPIVRDVRLPADTRKTVDEMFPPYPAFERRDGELVVPDGYEELFMTIGEHVFPAGQRDYLFRNDGYAQWKDVTKSAGLEHFGQGLSATWWDYDGDNDVDLYVANDLESPDKLYRNRGDGTFEDVTKSALPHTAFFGMGADFGDIDNDGRFDFCVADMSSTTHYMSKLLMGNMGDRRWFLMNSDPPQVMRNAVFLNTGLDRFAEVAHITGLASSDWTWTVRFADLDEDTRLDFFATNGMASFDNDPDAGTEFTRLWRSGRTDEALDVVRRLDRVEERNIARRNLGDLRFVDCGEEWGLADAGVSNGAVLADLDRDGDLDIVVNNTNEPAAIYENRSHGTRRVVVELRGLEQNPRSVGAKLLMTVRDGPTQVRQIIPTRGYMSSGEPFAYFGVGRAERIHSLDVTWPSGTTQSYRDLPTDHHIVIHEVSDVEVPVRVHEPNPMFVRSEISLAAHRENEFDDYAVQPLLPHRLSRNGPGAAIGDVNGDGLDDIFIGGASGQPGTLHVAAADGTYTIAPGPWRDDAASEDLGVVFLDVDSDGDLDLFVASGGYEHPRGAPQLGNRVYRNDGTGEFRRDREALAGDLRLNSSAVAAADYDRDGDVDLFVGSHATSAGFPSADRSVLLRNDHGVLTPVETDVLATAGLVHGATWADCDGDGWLDLVVAAQWQPIRVFGNRTGSLEDRTEACGLSAIRGQWNGIAAGDFDADGDLDLIATNLGLNTKYHADAHHPLRLFAADFDDDGVCDVIESKYEGDRLLPVRGRSCSSNAMPFVGEKFQTFQSFARATLPEIYGEAALASSAELTTTELRHLLLENRAGRFEPRPLPRRAQISAGYGIAIEDFNGDGRLDVVIAHNSFSPEPETGRHDGGLSVVLEGDGRLGFDVVPFDIAGLSVHGDAKALLTLDHDRDHTPDLLVTTNDGPATIWHGRRTGRSPAGTADYSIRLRGKPGNPTAIGARVAILGGDSADGYLAAGSGYLSQSAPIARFLCRPAPSPDFTPRPVEIRVTWPDGQTTTHTHEDGPGEITLSR